MDPPAAPSVDEDSVLAPVRQELAAARAIADPKREAP